MVTIKNVAIAGASGALGRPVLQALIDSQKFNITVLTRSDSNATFPSTVKTIPVDYSSLNSLTAAFKGQEAVILTLGLDALAGQNLIIDAAIAAGVHRILPSEFGSNTSNPKTAALPVFGLKIAVRKHIEERIAAGANITYTYVVNGPFLDWGLEVGFLVRWQEGKPTLYDNGENPFSATTLATVGQAVVGILEHEEETRNRAVFVQDIVTSQKRLLEIMQKVAAERKLEPQYVALDDLKTELDAKLAKGEMGEIYKYIFFAVAGAGYGAKFEKTDNELLGIKGKTEADVEAVWRKVLA